MLKPDAPKTIMAGERSKEDGGEDRRQQRDRDGQVTSEGDRATLGVRRHERQREDNARRSRSRHRAGSSAAATPTAATTTATM